jgi:hypothetical protein
MNKFIFFRHWRSFGDLGITQIRGRDRGDPREILDRALCFRVWPEDGEVEDIETGQIGAKINSRGAKLAEK